MIGRLLRRWRFLPPGPDELVPLARPAVAEPAPDPGPLVLELEPIYSTGATGAVTRLELADGAGTSLRVPPGVVELRARLVHRAGLYAGATTMADGESEPVPPALLRGARS